MTSRFRKNKNGVLIFTKSMFELYNYKAISIETTNNKNT